MKHIILAPTFEAGYRYALEKKWSPHETHIIDCNISARQIYGIQRGTTAIALPGWEHPLSMESIAMIQSRFQLKEEQF